MPTDFVLIENDWNAVIERAARPAARRLRVICPFIKAAALNRLLQAAQPNRIEVITRFNLADFYSGVSDTSALRHLLAAGASVKGVRNLHAKLYQFGDDIAIGTSANLTDAALSRNHEFGFQSRDADIIARCHSYFENMWNRAGALLTARKLDEWESRVLNAALRNGHPTRPTGLTDEGAELNFPPAEPLSSLAALENGRAFIKIIGSSQLRADPISPVLGEILASGSHWACSFPQHLPRIRPITDGDILFLARTVTPRGYRVYGWAVAIAYQPGRDDATEPEKVARPFKYQWPRYIRFRRTEFIAGTLNNGIDLEQLFLALGADTFVSTQRNRARERGENTDPRQSTNQQTVVRLAGEGFTWLQREFNRALAIHGSVPAADLASFDWPEIPAH